jgi:hypothetical protein
MKKRLMAVLSTLALFAIVGATSVTAGVTISETIPGNPTCTGTKIDPVGAGSHDLASGGHIVITLVSTAKGPTFDFDTEGSATVSAIMVKGGPNAILWSFNPAVDSYQGLHSPLNLNNNKWYGLSHICIQSEKKSSDGGGKK